MKFRLDGFSFAASKETLNYFGFRYPESLYHFAGNRSQIYFLPVIIFIITPYLKVDSPYAGSLLTAHHYCLGNNNVH